MNNIQSESNSKNRYNNTTYNYCAGKDCKNIPSHHLKLVLIKKSGWFCDKCRMDLEKDDLVQFVIDEHKEDNKRVSNIV
jgi:hypothetical protein